MQSPALREFLRSRARRSAAIAGHLLLGLIVATSASAASLVWLIKPFGGSADTHDVLTQRVTQGSFEHDVVERGELESSANVSIRCEVQSRASGSNGVKIIEIVSEGTVVKQGDFLVRFDDAALLSERTTQQINVNSAVATAAQSKNDLDAAIIARKEYEFGEFETEREKINGEILVASENASRAEETVENSERLARRGYMSKSRLRSDRFDLAKARSDLKVAQTKFRSLVEFTKEKKISELDAKVKTSDAKLKSDEAKLALEKQKLETIDQQIAKCSVKAPVDGQVIYDHERDHWGGTDQQIKPGAVIDEQRVVIRLPDPKRMQVIAKVAESRIDRIKQNMPAKIEIEGLPGVVLEGKVSRVNEYPQPENWFNANVKEFATKVEVLNPPAGLRPGMTARVAIRVETISSALQVPVQAVAEVDHKYYCVKKNGQALEPRQVQIGSTNEKYMVIRDGLASGDEVVLNPRAHLDRVTGTQPAGPPPVAADQQAQAARRSVPAVGGGGL